MDSSNNDSNISLFSRNEAKSKNNIITNRKLLLPKIKFQNRNNNKLDKNLLKNKKIRKKIFLTSHQDVDEEKNENKIIQNFLSNKITINKIRKKEDEIFQRNIILRKYMNEALLYRKTLFQAKKIGLIKLCGDDQNCGNKIWVDNFVYPGRNKRTIDYSINTKDTEINRKMKKNKSLGKNVVIRKSKDFTKPNLKKLNCNLKFHLFKNIHRINEVNKAINNLQTKSKIIYDGIRNEANNIIDKVARKKEDEEEEENEEDDEK